MKHTEALFPAEKTLSFHDSALDAASQADALLVLTEWDEFR